MASLKQKTCWNLGQNWMMWLFNHQMTRENTGWFWALPLMMIAFFCLELVFSRSMWCVSHVMYVWWCSSSCLVNTPLYFWFPSMISMDQGVRLGCNILINNIPHSIDYSAFKTSFLGIIDFSWTIPNFMRNKLVLGSNKAQRHYYTCNIDSYGSYFTELLC